MKKGEYREGWARPIGKGEWVGVDRMDAKFGKKGRGTGKEN